MSSCVHGTPPCHLDAGQWTEALLIRWAQWVSVLSKQTPYRACSACRQPQNAFLYGKTAATQQFRVLFFSRNPLLGGFTHEDQRSGGFSSGVIGRHGYASTCTYPSSIVSGPFFLQVFDRQEDIRGSHWCDTLRRSLGFTHLTSHLRSAHVHQSNYSQGGSVSPCQ